MKKAIKLTTKKKILDKDIKIIEYFEPYSYETLQEIDLLNDVVNKDKNSDKRSTSLDADAYSDTELIIEVEDDEVTNDSNDIYAPSEYDYLSDANVVLNLMTADDKDSTALLELSDKEMTSRELLFRAKIDISKILSIDIDDSCIDEAMNELSSTHDIDKETFQNVISGEITNHPKDSLIKRFVRDKFPLYKYLRVAKRLYKLDGILLKALRMYATDPSSFRDNKEIFISEIVKNVNSGKLLRDYKRMKELLYEQDITDKILKKYTKNENGCFAVMVDCVTGEKYFALSGGYDHLACSKQEKIALKIIQRLGDTERSISTVRDANINKISWAYLSDDVLSYFNVSKQYDRDNLEQKTPPISLGQHLKDEKITWRKFTELRPSKMRYFSCCERKIFAHSNNNDDKIFYVRFKPCEACIPAFKQTGGVKTVHYFNSDNKLESQIYT